MRKGRILFLAFALGMALTTYGNIQSTQSASAETIVCPGRGERCASKKVLGLFTVWKKKDEGGPGVIITEE